MSFKHIVNITYKGYESYNIKEKFQVSIVKIVDRTIIAKAYVGEDDSICQDDNHIRNYGKEYRITYLSEQKNKNNIYSEEKFKNAIHLLKRYIDKEYKKILNEINNFENDYEKYFFKEEI